MDEVLHVVSAKRGPEIAKRAWNHMLHLPNLSIFPVDEKVAACVLPFFEAGLEPRDAFHAATMKANGLATICSYDTDFDKIKSLKRQEP